MGTCKRNITNNGKALEVPITIEQIKQQKRDISVKSMLNESRVTPNAGHFDHSRQSNTCLQVSSDSNRTGCSIKSNETPPYSTDTTVDENSDVTERNKYESRKRSMSRERFQSRKRSKSEKCSESRKSSESMKKSESEKKLKSRDMSKSEK